MSKAFDLSQVGRGHGITADIGPYRNKIINGDFEISQRGNSFPFATGIGAGNYTIDRWSYRGTNSSGTAATISKLEMPSGYNGLPGYVRNYLRLSRTATGSDLIAIQNRIEGVTTLTGKQATLTFYIRGTTGGKVKTQINQHFGTGGTPTPTVTVTEASTEVVLSGTFTRYDVVFDMPAVSPSAIYGTSGNDRLEVGFILETSEGNIQFDIAHVSLVEGDATAEDDPFSPRHIQQELALCQRYYFQTQGELTQGLLYAGAALLTTAFLYEVCFPVEMRTQPTVTTLSAGTATNVTAGSHNFVPASTSVLVRCSVPAAGWYRTLSHIIGCDAEL